jgi:PadR family transcriptional regulator, regulatory protein PadR
MSEPTSLGQFEQVVLTAILSLGEDAYGVTIHARVEELSRPRKVAMGAVYVTLDRMTDKGLVRSWMSEPRPERGGRSRRYYRLEPAGEQTLREAVQAARRLCDAVEQSWGNGIWQPAKS